MSNILTPAGLEKIKKEISEIKETKLKDVAQRIKDAKDFGDLSENAEYQEARNEQAYLYGKLLELEEKVKNAKIIDKKHKSDTVQAGVTVVVKNADQKMNFEIVGSDESDPVNGRITIESPLGSALFGHKKGDSVEVSTPGGLREYQIVDIL